MNHKTAHLFLGLSVVGLSLVSLEAPAEAREGAKAGPVKQTGGAGPAKAVAEGKPSAGPAFDRLAWLAGLIAQLKNRPGPPCEGPRGCTLSIPPDSPCTRPAETHPEVVIDGVLPGLLPSTWAVAYRLVCSDCYLGGAGYLSLVRVGKGKTVRVLDTLALKKTADTEMPRPIEMISDDVDDDERPEVVIRYQNEREGNRKCAGLEDAAAFLLVARVDGNRLTEVLHIQSADRPAQKGRPYTASYRFEDENDDGYPDLVVKRTEGPEVACQVKGTKCDLKGEKGTRTIQTVRRYVEAAGDWTAAPFSGHALGPGDDIDCDVPLPETPFAVVARTLPGKKMTDDMEAEARALRAAGFSRACLYNGADFPGLKPEQFYVITGAHPTRGAADDEADTLRKAGFRPFVKELFQ